MRKNYEDPELNVTKFEYENIMLDVVGGSIPDEGDGWDPEN